MTRTATQRGEDNRLARVLVVDDERPMRRLLRVVLAGEGYEVLEAEDASTAVRTAAADRPDAIILDLGLPDGDGIEVIERVREWSAVPIIVLSVRDQEREKIRALDAGADDYLTKPFGTGELLARLRAALRRIVRTADEPVVTLGDLAVDVVRRRVTVRGQEVHLTSTEYTLLKTLAVNAGKVMTHRQLLRAVWGPGYEDAVHLLRVNMSNLRRKIEPDPVKPCYLITEPGVGYRLREAPQTGQ
ncbi:MAG: response regulator [Firmicutes bacterium]|nr:response regulator [Bacillota bacterium]